MIGPMFIHQRKKFESYYFFASSLVGLHPSMRNLQAFGTDEEKALANALHTVFNKAVHVRCFLHFKVNLDSRLQDLGIPKHERIEFLRDVFGNPLHKDWSWGSTTAILSGKPEQCNQASNKVHFPSNSMQEMVVCQRKEVEREKRKKSQDSTV